MAHITVTSEYHYSQQIASGHHRLTADEPIARGERAGSTRMGRRCCAEEKSCHTPPVLRTRT